MKVAKVSPAHSCKPPAQHRLAMGLMEPIHGCVKLICVANVGSQLTSVARLAPCESLATRDYQLTGPITRRTFAEQGVLVISTMIVKPGTA